jgi:U3 small nucleolar RNA-associated protein 10
VEFTKQMTLAVITELSNSFKSRDAQRLQKVYNMELIIHCLQGITGNYLQLVLITFKGSKSAQTHQKVLLLLGTLAKLFPQVVVTHIMTLFTFMGASVMRQDDNYTFYVIQKVLSDYDVVLTIKDYRKCCSSISVLGNESRASP